MHRRFSKQKKSEDVSFPNIIKLMEINEKEIRTLDTLLVERPLITLL
jgi:hypothetical protein